MSDPTPKIGKRTKCLPPLKGARRWCGMLAFVMNVETTRGLFSYDAMNFTKGTMRCLGVATRIGGKPKGRPVLFNHCPWCGEPINFSGDSETDAE